MSGNYTDVREMSGISLKVMEMSGNCQGKNLVVENYYYYNFPLYRVGHKKPSPILFCLKCYCICLYEQNDTPYKLLVCSFYGSLCSVSVDGSGFYGVIIMKSLSLSIILTVWSLTLTLVVQAWRKYQLKWSGVPQIIREMSGNFIVSGDWSPCE